MTTIDPALAIVRDAIAYAKRKHPNATIDCQPNRDTRVRILVEEVGEVAAECQNMSEAAANGMPGATAMHRRALVAELAQVAACTLLWLADEIAELGEDAHGASTLCSVCRAPQFMTRSGVTCDNGHGGAPSLVVAQHVASKEQP